MNSCLTRMLLTILKEFHRHVERQKTIPLGLVEDYLCGPHLLSRARESQRCIFSTLDISELVRKFTNLEAKMKSNL